ncbi:MAG: prepilin-type N-terminal cleavage/methylation domain-containing protein [Xanthomonadaceae bacterium]|nr:prepilin-type N-terminal cleavage/methylation domain-containing protein [Xanthomonadaceae bacterium]
MNARRADGFTLLEAIVALVIFSMGAFALYGWLSTSLHTLTRVDAGRETLALQQSALDLVRTVNPMATPRGRREMAGALVEWNGELVEPARRGRSQVGGETFFEVGLYRLDVRVSQGEREVGRFEVRQLGYRQVGGSGGE